MRALLLAALLLALWPVATADAQEMPVRSGLTWDFDLSLGFGHALDPVDEFAAFGRARAGVTMFREPWFFTTGVNYHAGHHLAAGIGYEIEVMHLWAGWWGQVGGWPVLSQGVKLGLGWSLFGFEWQYRKDPGRGKFHAVFGTIRAPLGLLVHALFED